MNQLNSVILEGNVTRDVKILTTKNGCKVCRIPIAVNRWYKNREGLGVSEVSYFDIETFGKMADYCETRANKGRGLRVVGRLNQNRWKNAEGKNTSAVEIVAEHIEFKPQLKKPADSAEAANFAQAASAAASEVDSVDSDENEEAVF